jgi:hypothetical protein
MTPSNVTEHEALELRSKELESSMQEHLLLFLHLQINLHKVTRQLQSSPKPITFIPTITMASRNPEAASNSNPDGFHASAPRDEPLMSSGHQPGKMVGNDAAPEFHAETLPAGTAPPEQ